MVLLVGREALSVVWATGRSFSLSLGCGDGTANPYRPYSALVKRLIQSHTLVTRSRALWHGIVCVMKVSDPLVLMEGSSAQAGRRGWAIAAAIIARLHESGFLDRIDVTEILGPAISDLSESELGELARQLSGPLMDTSRCFLGHHVREWQAACQVRPERTAYGRLREAI
jgi:hypothetical protein